LSLFSAENAPYFQAFAIGGERVFDAARWRQYVSHLVQPHCQVALHCRVIRQPDCYVAANVKGLAIGSKRPAEISLQHQHIAELDQRHAQIGLAVRVIRVLRSQIARDLESSPCVAPGEVRCAKAPISLGELGEHRCLAAPNLGFVLGSRCKLRHCGFSAIENAPRRLSLHTFDVAQPQGHIEYDRVDRGFGGSEVPLRSRPLRLGDAPLLDRNIALPIGNSGET
jgi:hypothetical protein